MIIREEGRETGREGEGEGRGLGARVYPGDGSSDESPRQSSIFSSWMPHKLAGDCPAGPGLRRGSPSK